MTAPVVGCVIGVCAFEAQGALSELKLYPATLLHQPQSLSGIPHLVEGETAEKMIAYLAELSAPFGTNIEYKDGIGLVKL
jgi:poly-gamma-glutamate synthesis protein (capsule biosynthesis protein)